MYTSFFGLNEKPFTITPDPRYLFMSERHGEGLAHLVYGVTEGGGFIQLTGEVGTGKTTLVRTLLGQIPAEVDIALILNPQLTAREFLTTICEELGIPLPSDRTSTKALVDTLNHHLLESHARGRRIILLIDEAQNLSEGVLEQLRLLTNLETARQKLLQIILIAQPELRDKLAQDNLRQLAQRVTGRYHLEPLTREESFRYIDHRLRVAGALTEIFKPAAKAEVFRLSGGVPRLINVICDRALLGAYTRETRTVGKSLVRKAAAEVSGQKIWPAPLKWILPLALASFIGGAAVLLWSTDWRPARQAEPTANITLPLQVSATEAAAGDAPLAEATPPPATVGSAVTSAEVATNIGEHIASADDVDGFATVLRLWDVDFDPGKGTACEQAQSSGLRCVFQRGTWSTLRQLDRPVVLTLIDDGGVSHQVALTGLNDKTAKIFVDGRTLAVPVEALSDYWFGPFVLIWRPVNDNDQPIRPGMRNEDVRWLKQSLAALDPDYQPAADDDDFFDAELEQRVISFQRQNRLQADGLAGQKTQIIINTKLALDGTPRLSDEQQAVSGT